MWTRILLVLDKIHSFPGFFGSIQSIHSWLGSWLRKTAQKSQVMEPFVGEKWTSQTVTQHTSLIVMVMWNKISPKISWWDQNLENAQSPHVFLIISSRFVYVSTRDPVESYRLGMTGWSWIIGRLDFALRGKLFEEHRECNERGGKFCFKIFEGTGPQRQVTIISHFPHKNTFSLRGNFCLMAFS